MKYTVAVEIDRPLPEVVTLYDDPGNWPEWRDGFVSAEPLRGRPGEEGSITKLVNRVGGRDTEMTETVERKNLPEEMTCVYQAPGYLFGAWNKTTSRFSELDAGSTEWTFESEFRCTGLLSVMAFVMPGMFRSATLKEMNSFKAFAEGNRQDGRSEPQAREQS